MEAIGHLPGLRGSKTRTLRIGSPTVTADDFDTGMREEPLFQCLGFPIWQEFYRNALLKVYQDRSERFGAKKREIIDPKHARRRMVYLWLCANKPKQRIGAGGEAHACHQALSCFSAERKADERED